MRQAGGKTVGGEGHRGDGGEESAGPAGCGRCGDGHGDAVVGGARVSLRSVSLISMCQAFSPRCHRGTDTPGVARGWYMPGLWPSMPVPIGEAGRCWGPVYDKPWALDAGLDRRDRALPGARRGQPLKFGVGPLKGNVQRLSHFGFGPWRQGDQAGVPRVKSVTCRC